MYLIRCDEKDVFLGKEDYRYLDDTFTHSYYPYKFTAKPFLYASKESAERVKNGYIQRLEDDKKGIEEQLDKLTKDLKKYQSRVDKLEKDKEQILSDMQSKPMPNQLVDFEKYKEMDAELAKLKSKIAPTKKYIKNCEKTIEDYNKSIATAKDPDYFVICQIKLERC